MCVVYLTAMYVSNWVYFQIFFTPAILGVT